MKTGHEEGMQIGEHRLVMFSQMFHFSCSRWCAALCDISNVLDRVHPSIRPILAAHEQASMSLEDIEALKKATSEFIGEFEAACKELKPLVRDLAEAEQKVKMTYSGFMRGCEAVESERRALYLRGLVELLKARAACLEPVEGAALPWGAEGCFAATAPTATENTSREPTPGAVKGKGVWHISPEEREKYKGALAEKPKREEVEQFIEDFAEEVAVIKQAVEHAGESDSPSSASRKWQPGRPTVKWYYECGAESGFNFVASAGCCCLAAMSYVCEGTEGVAVTSLVLGGIGWVGGLRGSRRLLPREADLDEYGHSLEERAHSRSLTETFLEHAAQIGAQRRAEAAAEIAARRAKLPEGLAEQTFWSVFWFSLRFPAAGLVLGALVGLIIQAACG